MLLQLAAGNHKRYNYIQMAETNSNKPDTTAGGSPEPEVLKSRSSEDSKPKGEESTETVTSKKGRLSNLRAKYHLSHKATFFGIVAVVVILLINVAIVWFVIRGQSESGEDDVGDNVVINQEVLDGLGVNRSAVSDLGAELRVGPNARFDKQVQIAGQTTIGGELILNDVLSANDASFANLQASQATLDELNVNGDGSFSNLIARNDVTVAGTSRLQGTTTVSGLLTVENSASVAGNLNVGGTLSVNSLQTGSLTIDSALILGGKIISNGAAPSVSSGPAAGSNGSVSISGNDTAGTVGFNAGAGAGSGIVARVSFRSSYPTTPRVVITPVGNVGSFYISRNSSGFSIGVGNAVAPGGYAFDYIVVQ